jgi:segregation and condensation protein A
MSNSFVYKTEKFEGPLELLLEMIEAEKMPIAEISLAHVTDEFLSYVNNINDLPIETIADFLTVAAKLMVIKARLLTDSLAPDEDDGPTLEQQLKMYKDYRDASRWIWERLRQEQFAFSRPKTIFLLTPRFAPPVGLTPNKMAVIFKRSIDKLRPIIDLPKKVIARAITIAEKISYFKDFINQRARFKFFDTLNSSSKTEIIVSFLAMLELVKQQVIDVAQEDHLADIQINRL